jgi:hypothetical protein
MSLSVRLQTAPCGLSFLGTGGPLVVYCGWVWVKTGALDVPWLGLVLVWSDIHTLEVRSAWVSSAGACTKWVWRKDVAGAFMCGTCPCDSLLAGTWTLCSDQHATRCVCSATP